MLNGGGTHPLWCLIWTSDEPDDLCNCGALPDPNDTVDPDAVRDRQVSRDDHDRARGAA